MSSALNTTSVDFLGIQNLAAILECEYAVLRRYAEARGVSELMGGVAIKGKLGLRYPAASLNRWRQLLDLHDARAVTPQTAAAVLPVLWGEVDGGGPAMTKVKSTPPPSNDPIVAELSRIVAALDRIAAVQEQLAGPKRKRKRKTKG